MPLSPSMNVIRLLQEAVFMKAGSYVIKPKSSSEVLIWRRSIALIVPFSMGRSYCFPVRLSVTVKLFPLMAVVSSDSRAFGEQINSRQATNQIWVVLVSCNAHCKFADEVDKH